MSRNTHFTSNKINVEIKILTKIQATIVTLNNMNNLNDLTNGNNSASNLFGGIGNDI